MQRVRGRKPKETSRTRLTFVHTCKQCKRRFEMKFPEEWAYRVKLTHGRLLFCSWHCLREWERIREQTPSSKEISVARTMKRNEEIYRRYMAGETLTVLAKAYGLSIATVDNAVKQVRTALADRDGEEWA